MNIMFSFGVNIELKSESTKMALTAAASECIHKIIFKFYLCRAAEEICKILRQFLHEFTHDLINDHLGFMIS